MLSGIDLKLSAITYNNFRLIGQLTSTVISSRVGAFGSPVGKGVANEDRHREYAISARSSFFSVGRYGDSRIICPR
jgi:hypothetical protein